MTTGNTITTTNESFAIAGFGRLAFFANTRYWVFYCDSNAEYYRTSLDKTTWSTATAVANIPDDDGIVYAGGFSVVSDGTYVHMALTDDQNHGGTWYRRATINSNGTLTYSAAWQTVDLDTAGTPIIALDSNGYPWISMNNDWDTGYPMVWKSSTKDGTWTNVSGFPYTPESKTDYPNLAPLTSGKMGVVLFSNESSKAVKYIEWSGSAWGSISTVDTNTNDNTPFRNSVATYGDNIIACYNSYSLDLTKYIDRVSSSWGGGNLIAHGSIYTSIAIDPTTGNAYAFTGYDTNNTTLLYQMYTAGTNTWGTLTTLVDDTPHTNIRGPQPFYLTGSIGIVYIESVGAPYYIKFASLSLGGGATVITPSAASQTLTASTLTLGYDYNPINASQTLTGASCTVQRVYPPTAASLTLTGSALGIWVNYVYSIGAASLSLTGSSLGISVNYVYTPGSASLSLTGSALGISVNYNYTPASASLSLTGASLGISVNYVYNPGSASLGITGNSLGISILYVYSIGGTSLVLSGNTLTLGYDYTPASTSLTLTGSPLGISIVANTFVKGTAIASAVAAASSSGSSVVGASATASVTPDGSTSTLID